MQHENIDNLSKAITHFTFRNGPIEDMHANGQLSEQDMMILNKYMVNRIAGILTAIANDDWVAMDDALNWYEQFGTQWDKAEPDTKEFEVFYQIMFKQLTERISRG